ncbi:uncharacterized protein LY89DRAFT_597110 [Mollisia scopiformis]|uniref:Uncharacterized protein n=1 Tax=Mollisia scopiformis TaxID=149040 RepID=A0A132BCE6_MOLSC|nr:uncharacterized protein LY89DRAFT_597110 [Mollisia scopiformis]KUJ10085.1 hypothetical protein LY89DRAFT_597110 [Mollisia scopiformis]
MDVQELDFATREQPRKVVVGIDYGTTFTSVSYLVCPDEASTTRVFPHEIGTVSDWPSDNMCGASMQVPTELWYSSIPKMRDPRTGRLELSDSETEEDSDELDEEDDDIPRFSTKKPALDPFRIIRGSAPPPASCQNSEASSEDLWGYECPYQKYCAHSTRSKDRYVERPKLMLLTSEHTRADRERLGPILQHLIDKRNIRKYGKAGSRPGARDIQDVVLDFFVPVLLHTRRELIKRDRYTDDCHVLFALTVPINWQPRSSRILQLALEEAIRLTGFGTLKDRSVTNLFVVSEPKAAATYLLGLGHARDLQSGDTFVVLDCGGGTVDGSSYSIAKSASLRLGEEICDPSGHNCGASYLNENFRKLVQYRLKEETYLEGNGNTLDSFVDDVMVRFETYEKRNKDIMGRPSTQIKIPGLKARRPRTLPGNTPEKYQDNYLLLFVDDFKQIFLPVLKDVAKILDAQLEAETSSLGIQKVFLIGGFAGAVSMRSFLKDHLAKFISDRNLPYSIDLILPSAQECIKAVSAGAVMQALHPEEGTVRDFVSSYGFFVKEFYTPEAPGHMNAKPIYDEYDGHRYVGIIDYFVMKGDVISPKHRFKRFKYTHVFDVECRRLRCEEVLYVSYKTVANGYPLDHRHNRDAQEEDKITTDFTFLRDEHKIEPVPACVSWDGTVREEHYSITYELVPYLDGRDLKYEAWYPSVKYGQRLKQKQICIASALHPGTV